MKSLLKRQQLILNAPIVVLRVCIILISTSKRAKYDAQRFEEEQRAVAQAALRRQQEQKKREAEMTWVQGIFGFIKELKKALKEDT